MSFQQVLQQHPPYEFPASVYKGGPPSRNAKDPGLWDYMPPPSYGEAQKPLVRGPGPMPQFLTAASSQQQLPVQAVNQYQPSHWPEPDSNSTGYSVQQGGYNQGGQQQQYGQQQQQQQQQQQYGQQQQQQQIIYPAQEQPSQAPAFQQYGDRQQQQQQLAYNTSYDSPMGMYQQPSNINQYPPQGEYKAGSNKPSRFQSGANTPQYQQQQMYQQNMYQQNLAAAALAMPAAGKINNTDARVEIPKQGRGIYSLSSQSGHLTPGQMGIAPYGMQEISPTGKKDPRHQDGWQRNADVLGPAQAGITGAHNRKDGLNSFEGFYGKSFAGKSSQSSLGYVLNPPLLTEGPSRPVMPAPPAPWDGPPQVINSGVRMMLGAPQSTDHLFNAPSGLSGGPPEVPRGRPLLQHRAAQSSITNVEQGLSHNSVPYSYGGKLNVQGPQSQLVQKKAGLVQSGQASRFPGVYDGKTNESQLQNGPEGMAQKPSGPGYRPINHAGKITASNIVQANGGISSIPKNSPHMRAPAAGQGQWSTSYDDTYKVAQDGQQEYQHFKAQSIIPQRF